MNAIRDKLIDIFGDYCFGYVDEDEEKTCQCSLAECKEERKICYGKSADYFLENGVIVPPCKLNQTLWRAVSVKLGVQECKVSSLTQKSDGSFKIRITVLEYKSVCEITPDEIGKTVFLTKEEAEKALKGRNSDN